MGVITFANLPLVSNDIEWNGNKARQNIKEWATDSEGNIDFNKFKKGFLWFDDNASDNLTGYKLPIADIIDGELKAIPKGIFASAAAINDARGGVDIPEEDIKKIKSHLNKYYNKLNMDSPFNKRTVPEEEILFLNELRKRTGEPNLHIFKESITPIKHNEIIQKDGQNYIEMQIFPYGEYFLYGEDNIQNYNESFADSMINSFNGNIRGQNIPIDEDHKMGNAYGWIQKLYKKEDGVYCLAELTPIGYQKIKDKEYCYNSMAYVDNYINPRTQQFGRNVLVSHAVTNYPALKGIKPMPMMNEFKNDYIKIINKSEISSMMEDFFNKKMEGINIMKEDKSKDKEKDKIEEVCEEAAEAEVVVDNRIKEPKKKSEEVEDKISEVVKKTEDMVKLQEEQIKKNAEEKVFLENKLSELEIKHDEMVKRHEKMLYENRKSDIKKRFDKLAPESGKDNFKIRVDQVECFCKFAETLNDEQVDSLINLLSEMPGTTVVLKEIGNAAGAEDVIALSQKDIDIKVYEACKNNSEWKDRSKRESILRSEYAKYQNYNIK